MTALTEGSILTSYKKDPQFLPFPAREFSLPKKKILLEYNYTRPFLLLRTSVKKLNPNFLLQSTAISEAVKHEEPLLD